MARNAGNDRLAYEAEIQANAVSYTAHLFLGSGRYERAEARSRAEILAIGWAMKAAYPECQADPIYYAVSASGASTTIPAAVLADPVKLGTPAQSKEQAMIRVTTNSHTNGKTSKSDMLIAAAAKRTAKTDAQRARRAAKKQANGHPPADLVAAEAKADLAPELDSAKAAEPHPVGRILPDLSAKKPATGLCKTKEQAEAEAAATYGADAKPNADFTLKKTAAGQWFWGPYQEPDMIKKAYAAKQTPEKKAAAKSAKAAAKAPAARPAIKRSEILANAERGILPQAPDFTAETHKRFRPKLAEVVALVKAGDVKGLKACQINPISSSPKAIDKYRNLALTALKAKAAK